jgi:hypothetical protein
MAVRTGLRSHAHCLSSTCRTSTVTKPGCCLAQVDRQLPRVEVGVLDQAAADRGLGNQHRQAKASGLPAGVRPPIPPFSAPADAHARSAAASRYRNGFKIFPRRMAAPTRPPPAAPERLSPHRRRPVAVG